MEKIKRGRSENIKEIEQFIQITEQTLKTENLEKMNNIYKNQQEEMQTLIMKEKEVDLQILKLVDEQLE